ncbi:MAG: L-serine ammonia-lyase [Betaproteobacteria bacterium]|nr:MAG: L-serine ammonia-lyase [Betaproteobacteria bacterium]
MFVSAFDLFKIGLGPSSSHTVGPMRAALRFVHELAADGKLDLTERVGVDLYGSLALTGRGHGTDRAVLLGLSGDAPDRIDPDAVEAKVHRIRAQHSLRLDGRREIAFREQEDLRFRIDKALAFHSNGMRFTAHDATGAVLFRKIYFSVGGGFVVDEAEAQRTGPSTKTAHVPYAFASAAELLEHGNESKKRIPEMMRVNELTLRSPDQVRSGLLERWMIMNDSIERGMRHEGLLPGGLNVRRRAPGLVESLRARRARSEQSPTESIDWVSVYAIAVNEENAAGGRVVTAPTNGAAGIIPAVIRYYREFYSDSNEDGIVSFLLTAAAVGGLCKRNASLSGAEVGCQGEVGVACSMAAAGLAAVLGGSNEQIENAAEIGIEHHLGMSCDPVAGLVQIPCIERNAMGAVKAINAASLALRGDGTHRVALDAVIKTMYDTGRDMMAKYKETSLGGLAVNVVDC